MEKPFALFACDNYYPNGGWDDFQGLFDTVEAARAEFFRVENDYWGHIVDLRTQEIVEDFRKEFEYLRRVILDNDARERKAQAAAARDFEARVGELIAVGAGNRETALRWIMEADGNGYNDWEYVAFVNGLPCGYFRKEAV